MLNRAQANPRIGPTSAKRKREKDGKASADVFRLLRDEQNGMNRTE
jgi:hypothetical protein